MKKGQLILNIVFAIAIIGLYAIKLNNKPQQDTNIQTQGSTSMVSGNIAFVDIDTIRANYDMFFDLQQTFQKKTEKSQIELDQKVKAFEKSAQDFQYKVQKGLVTRSTAQEMQQGLAQEEQRLMQLREKLTYELAEEEQVMSRQVLESITSYLKENYNGSAYHYVLSHAYGSNILFANDSLNITYNVLNGINDSYKQSKK
ncbi:OmpH family outer membrane protein [Bacteroidales bacterium]|nr:OmpH family outer membrane protein [Bacteroidales bacterium]